MSDFNVAFVVVIGLEGGYSNNPDDRGGETKWGISKRSFPYVDIKNLTRDAAKMIYFNHFWRPMRLDRVVDNDIATEIFEQGVNMGASQAIHHVQQAINVLQSDYQVVEDGVIGPQTLAALNATGRNLKIPLLKTLNGLQFIWYLSLAEDKRQRANFVGWLRRVSLVEGVTV